ncbi:ABC transporter permease [Sanguibacter massiliensis]|uniref:ABC transporter permease n=1 Tax=Sanguibacter massiliensis TaxID=1973217 RepID=UPI000C83E254|nr:ABC transporter permease [Sanguibacter massiliensis]
MSQTTAPARPIRARSARRPVLEGQELVLIGVIAVLWLVLSLMTDTFFTGANIRTILYAIAPVAIIGVGMTAVMVTAGIDVSVGSQLAIVTAIVATMIRDSGTGLAGAVVIALVVGCLLGSVNAALIVFGRIHPMIVTFGTLNIFRFVALQVFGDAQIAGVPDVFRPIGGSSTAVTFGIPNAMWLTLLLVAVQWAYMRYWAGGRHIYAIGNDQHAARLAGVRVNMRLFLVYVSVGAMVAIASLVQLGSGGLVQQNVGIGLEMQVIAACVIGGTSVLGGRGTVVGTLLGAVLIGTVTSAITLLGLSSQLSNLFVGVFIVLAVGIDLVRQNRRSRL